MQLEIVLRNTEGSTLSNNKLALGKWIAILASESQKIYMFVWSDRLLLAM